MYYLYSKDSCPWCVKAKDLLKQKGIEYLEYNIQQSPDLKTRLLQLVPDAKTVPQIFDGADHIGGYTELEKHLETN
jgi:glutaredoxin 3